MVVPTMLARILDVLGEDSQGLPNLRHLSYGGGRMPLPVIEQAMALLPHVDFVNAYGLTETSSSIAVLGPQDHRDALAATSQPVRARLASVGRPLPTVEIEIRDEAGQPVSAGTPGEIYVRGDQVSGEYTSKAGTDGAGWFATNDGGWFDDDGFLFVSGRMDDVIVRGGENLSPGEIEDVILGHPAIRECAVVGVPDTQWGETVAAVVVVHDGAAVTAEELQRFVNQQLRSARTPTIVEFRPELPYNDTGKVLRRALRAQLAEQLG
jgi:acyl-CoA synthetase (AMP-forming)/AMP-acid ligase II